MTQEEYKNQAKLAMDAKLCGRPLPVGVTHVISYDSCSCGVFFDDDYQVTVYYNVGDAFKQEYV